MLNRGCKNVLNLNRCDFGFRSNENSTSSQSLYLDIRIHDCCKNFKYDVLSRILEECGNSGDEQSEKAGDRGSGIACRGRAARCKARILDDGHR